jgi:hypothetical protein
VPLALPLAQTDPELARVLAAWPHLSPAVRKRILKLIGPALPDLRHAAPPDIRSGR